MLKSFFKIAAFAVLVYILSKNVDLSWMQNVEAAKNYFHQLGPWAPFPFLALFVVGALIHAPELITVALGGIIFGGVMGVVYGWIGAMLAGSTCFLIGRYVFRDAFRTALIERFKALRQLDSQFEKYGVRTVMLLRFVLFLAPPMNWAVSATRIRFRDYLLGSAIGLIPGLVLTVAFSQSLAKLTSVDQLLTPDVLVLGSLVLAFVVTSLVVARRYFPESEAESETERPAETTPTD
ncbi:MAG: VTT domain-containing protein [Candidatus Binatia bacterium]|nr:VTT domain-containing protein [Candidatus Binatia bacterium]